MEQFTTLTPNKKEQSMTNKTLFIGCGGSGLKTLQRLNELLSGNPANRQMMRENISYLLLDTSLKETEAFKENIKKHLGNAGLPFIKVVQFTRNYLALEEIVKPTFMALEKKIEDKSICEGERAKAEKQLARLKENWWYSPDHKPGAGDLCKTTESVEPCKSYPFLAQHIPDLGDGAGQCSPVAFLSAWNYLPSLEQDIREVIDAIQLRNTDNQQMRLNVFVVAGTAGGTGRGCWAPVAFKVAQSLRKMGFNCNPTGVFFDSSCFANVVAGSPTEKLNLAVNSLTAMSELSAWMMQPVIRSYYFSLPNLRDPGICEEGQYCTSTDVVAVPADGDNELAPVTNAYLIFGNNGVAPLANNDQYHEMAAAALYAMVAEDKFIGPGAVNHHEAIRSFGALTFEVETVPIRRYMEALVRREYSKSLYLEAKPRPEKKEDADPAMESAYKLNDEMNRIVGVLGNSYPELDVAAKPFFARTGFYVDQKLEFSSVVPNNDAKTLLPKLMAKAATAACGWGGANAGNAGKGDSGFTKSKAILLEALKSQNVQNVNARIKELLSLKRLSAEVVEGFLSEMGLGDANVESMVRDAVLGAFSPEGMTASVGRALAVLKKLKDEFVISRTNLIGDADNGNGLEIPINGSNVRTAEECITLFQKEVIELSSKKSFFSLKALFRKKFSKIDVGKIAKSLELYLVWAIFFKVNSVLAKKFKCAIDVLTKLEKSLQMLVDGLHGVQKSFDAALCKSCGIESGNVDEAYRKLFIDYNPSDLSAVFQALPKMDANQNVYRRVLKPIKSREEVLALVRENTNAYEAPVRECLAKYMRDLTRGDVYVTPEDAQEAIRKDFVDLISANVSLEFRNGVDFMTAHFSFEEVLKGNVKAWNDLLRARKGSEDDLGELKDRLRKYVGVSDRTLNKLEDGTQRIDARTIWDDIVVSMAGDCKPWMRLKDNAREVYLKTIALLPWNMNDEGRGGDQGVSDLVNRVKEKFQGKILSVQHTGNGSGFSLSKDRIVVFSATAVTVEGDENPFDSIKSLDYYENADLSRLLIMAEDDKDVCGYYFPIRNPAAKIPWGERRDSHGFVSPIFIKNAALASTRWRPWKKWDGGYDVMKQRETDLKSAICFALLGTGISDELKKTLVDAGWTEGPIFVKGEKQESIKFARKCHHDKNAWKDGKEFSTIAVLSQYLSGEGRESYQRQGGAALEKEKAEGARARVAILEELASFRENVSKKVGTSVVGELVKSLANWLERRDDNAASKPEVWQELYAFVNSGAFKLD